MSTDLDSLTDAQLSEVFAVEVAEMPPLFTLMKRGYYYRPNANGYTSHLADAWKVTEDVADQHVYPHDEPVTKHSVPRPPFAASADAVLPFIPTYADARKTALGWTIEICNEHGRFRGAMTTFARAACIALIKAKRAEKEDAK